MWIGAGLVFVGLVLWYWLRRLWRTLDALGFVFEAAINRSFMARGEREVVSEEEAEQRWG